MNQRDASALLTVGCPGCKAKAGELCRTRDGRPKSAISSCLSRGRALARANDADWATSHNPNTKPESR